MAGTVNTHWISFALKYSSPVRWQITLMASSFKNLIEWANTVLALTRRPLAAFIVVSVLMVYEN